MLKFQGVLFHVGVTVAMLLFGVSDNALANDFSNVYFFGDSLSDSGTFGPIVGTNRRFTTNPGTVWTENLGAEYGKSVTPAYAAWLRAGAGGFTPITGGNNFAVGSARVNEQPAGSGPLAPLASSLPSVATQVDSFLTRGTTDPGALYALWAGGNDVFAQFVSGAATPSAAALAAMLTAASDLTAQIVRLQSAGARNLIVLTLADSTQFPYGLAMNDAERAQITILNSTFNTALISGIAGKNVLCFDVSKLLSAILANPGAFGITNTVDPAFPAGTSSLGHAVAADGHLFADDRHPSTIFHQVVSDWVYASLEGASRIGVLSLMPLKRSGAQWRSIDGRMQEFENFGYEGQGLFVSGDYAESVHDAAGALPSAEGTGGSAVLGYERAFTDQLFGGVSLGYGHTPFDLGNNQGEVRYDEWALSVFAAHKMGNWYANLIATYTWLDFESERTVALGSFTSNEHGDTHGDQFGVKGQIGYNLIAGKVVHGPLAALAWERVQVDGFSEDSGSVTAMTFGDQTRESLRSKIGWQIAAEAKWAGANVRPYAQLTYDYEHNDDERSYNADFIGGTSGIEIQTENLSGGYGTALVGVNVELTNKMGVGVGASTTIAHPEERNTAMSVTFSVPF